MIILGIHHGHDSSAAVVIDGKVVVEAAEERFTRLKHCHHVPTKAIQFCLQAAGLGSINDVDYVAYSWRQPSYAIQTVLGLPDDNSGLHRSSKAMVKAALQVFGFSGYGSERLKPPIYFPHLQLKDTKKFVPVDHHLAHAASAYFTRPTASRCLVFTIDGAGDNTSTAVWLGEGNDLRPLERRYRDASIGWAYSIVTEGLHWWHGDGEGKTMGLAPYGDPEKCRGVLDFLFPVFRGAELTKPTNLSSGYYWIESGATQFHFDEAYLVEKLAEQYGKENIAAEAQRKLEECVIEFVYGWLRKEECDRSAYSGGVFLNVKLNQRIWNNREDRVAEQHIFPNPGDGGLAVGAALYVYYRHRPFEGCELSNLYLGPEFSNAQISKILEDRQLPYNRVEDPARKAAQLLSENMILGWFQGRMESGPRALGNRSILMSPLRNENKDIINAKVKFREMFRPFCPSLVFEKRDDYLQDARNEFFMITSFDCVEAKKKKIPAVVHVDGTLRPQLVKKEHNSIYWDLINHFGEITGEHIVLNTSFNIKGEPIINTPMEAIRCFYDGGLDALFLGDHLLTKALPYKA